MDRLQEVAMRAKLFAVAIAFLPCGALATPAVTTFTLRHWATPGGDALAAEHGRSEIAKTLLMREADDNDPETLFANPLDAAGLFFASNLTGRFPSEFPFVTGTRDTGSTTVALHMPEPATWAFMIMAFAGLAFIRRHHRALVQLAAGRISA